MTNAGRIFSNARPSQLQRKARNRKQSSQRKASAGLAAAFIEQRNIEPAVGLLVDEESEIEDEAAGLEDGATVAAAADIDTRTILSKAEGSCQVASASLSTQSLRERFTKLSSTFFVQYDLMLNDERFLRADAGADKSSR